jgi:hypothetical protein
MTRGLVIVSWVTLSLMGVCRTSFLPLTFVPLLLCALYFTLANFGRDIMSTELERILRITDFVRSR